MSDDAAPCPEFDCCECGRHVFLICGALPEPPLCAACMCIPGWFDLPDLRARTDPEGHASPLDPGSAPAWTGGAHGGL